MSTNGNTIDEGLRWDRGAAPARPAVMTAVPDFGSFMRQVFPDTRLGEEPPSTGLRRDYETALNLLNRASEAFPALLRHCQRLEGDLKRVRADAQAAIDHAAGETQQWQQIAVALKMHVEENEGQLAAVRKRLAAVEERLSSRDRDAKMAEKQASLAIGITTLFHDKIVDAFGVGSSAHSALDAIAQGVLDGIAPDENTR